MEDEKQRWNNQHDPSTSMLQCRTYLLWFPIVDEEQISMIPLPAFCNAQLTLYDSQWRMNIRDGMMISMIPLPACCNAELTSYDFQWRMKSRDGMISMIPLPACCNAQLTSYDFEWRMKSRDNDQHDHSTMMLQCTTHLLWFPVKDEEQRWNDQHDPSTRKLQCTTHLL